MRMIRANGVDLCVDTFGDPADPAILLIMGNSASMDWWDPELCQRLAAGSRFVIRYDQRDTGQSTSFPAGKPPYTGTDMLADALGILDELGIARAHLVGMSGGGGAAQQIVLDHPDRVASVTLASTTAMPADDLPGMSEELGAVFADPPPQPDWSDRDAAIAYLVADQRGYSSRSRPFDEPYWRALAGRIVDRTRDLAASMTNHWLVEGGEPWRARLAEIAVPVLVVHGTDDPLFPLPHGEALAREIPGARLLTLPGVGHEPPPPDTWDTFVPAVLAVTDRSAGR